MNENRAWSIKKRTFPFCMIFEKNLKKELDFHSDMGAAVDQKKHRAAILKNGKIC